MQLGAKQASAAQNGLKMLFKLLQIHWAPETKVK